ncbi:hypothetical protein D9M68_933610 [compost metagenome]
MDYRKLAAKLLEHEPARSEAFHQGLAAVLRNRVDGSLVNIPHPAGTAEADAFYAGQMRGHNEFRNLLIETNSDREAAIARLRHFASDERRVA